MSRLLSFNAFIPLIITVTVPFLTMNFTFYFLFLQFYLTFNCIEDGALMEPSLRNDLYSNIPNIPSIPLKSQENSKIMSSFREYIVFGSDRSPRCQDVHASVRASVTFLK